MKSFSYLDNLVARNMPETAVIQPRPVSVFEPLPGMVTPFPDPAIAEEETAVIPPTAYPSPAMPATPPQPRASLTPDTAVSSPPIRPASAQPESIRPLSEAGTRTPKPSPIEHTDRPRKQSPVNIPPVHVEAIPKPPNHQVEPQSSAQINAPIIIKEQITQIIPKLETPEFPFPPLAEVAREKPAEPTPSAAPAAAIPPAQPTKPVVPAVTLRTEQVKTAAPAANQPGSHQPPVATSPEPIPTVQITIGRIEVRATPPTPAKAEKKPAPTPVLSLEDYLRQRNGGRS